MQKFDQVGWIQSGLNKRYTTVYLGRDVAQSEGKSVVREAPLGEVQNADVVAQAARQSHDEGTLAAAGRSVQQVPSVM